MNTRNNKYVDNIKQQITKALSRDIVCIFEIFFVITIYYHIAAIIKCYRTKIIIHQFHHINVVPKPPRTLTVYFLS